MYNCSLFGLGRAGKIHYKNIINNKFLNLKYIYDLEENIKDIENKVDSKIKVTSSLDDILRDREVTISIICTPTNFHYSFIKVSLRNGNHVLCEKPLSNSEEEIIECYELANSQNLVLLCALNRRFDPEIINLKNKISTIGKIHKVMTISRDYPYPTLDYLKISSGIFHDCAVHDIDYINWILDDKPINVYTTGNKVFMVDKGGDELDNAIIIMEYANGIIGLVNISRISTNYDQRIEIYGTNDVLTMINNLYSTDFKTISFKKIVKKL